MIRRRLFLLTMILAVAAGCPGGGGGEYVPPASEADQIAQTKTMVINFVDVAKQRPKEAPSELTLLLEALEPSVEVTNNASAETLAAAKELKALYDRNAPKTEIDAQLQKLADTANAM